MACSRSSQAATSRVVRPRQTKLSDAQLRDLPRPDRARRSLGIAILALPGLAAHPVAAVSTSQVSPRREPHRACSRCSWVSSSSRAASGRGPARASGYGAAARANSSRDLAGGCCSARCSCCPCSPRWSLLDMRELKPGFEPRHGALDQTRRSRAWPRASSWRSSKKPSCAAPCMTAIARESGSLAPSCSPRVVYAATHFIGRYRVRRRTGRRRAAASTCWPACSRRFAHPLAIIDAFLCLTAVGILLGMVRALTGNIAPASACTPAGWP